MKSVIACWLLVLALPATAAAQSRRPSAPPRMPWHVAPRVLSVLGRGGGASVQFRLERASGHLDRARYFAERSRLRSEGEDLRAASRDVRNLDREYRRARHALHVAAWDSVPNRFAFFRAQPHPTAVADVMSHHDDVVIEHATQLRRLGHPQRALSVLAPRIEELEEIVRDAIAQSRPVDALRYAAELSRFRGEQIATTATRSPATPDALHDAEAARQRIRDTMVRIATLVPDWNRAGGFQKHQLNEISEVLGASRR